MPITVLKCSYTHFDFFSYPHVIKIYKFDHIFLVWIKVFYTFAIPNFPAAQISALDKGFEHFFAFDFSF